MGIPKRSTCVFDQKEALTQSDSDEAGQLSKPKEFNQKKIILMNEKQFFQPENSRNVQTSELRCLGTVQAAAGEAKQGIIYYRDLSSSTEHPPGGWGGGSQTLRFEIDFVESLGFEQKNGILGAAGAQIVRKIGPGR